MEVLNYYKPEHFELYELVPRDIYERYSTIGKLHILWGILDPRVLWTNDRLRERYGRMVMNDWWWGGKNQYRGWRPPNCEIGSILSQHRFARGSDLIPTETTAERIRDDILADPFDEDFQYITCIEMDVGWLHFDTRNWDKKSIGVLKVYPGS